MQLFVPCLILFFGGGPEPGVSDERRTDGIFRLAEKVWRLVIFPSYVEASSVRIERDVRPGTDSGLGQPTY